MVLFSPSGDRLRCGRQRWSRGGGIAMEAAVVGLSGARAGERFTVGAQPITFGRSAENAVRVASTLASRVHAELRPEPGGYILRDLGSANGTWVNGVLVTVHELQPGDEITIGDEAFRFETGAPA